MADKIRIGILGYGNLGKGVELAVRQNPDMELAAFFTRRAPESLKTQSPEVPVYNIKDILDKKDDIDVMILCGGSATDLPVQTPALAKTFNVIDSFDTHAKIPEHIPLLRHLPHLQSLPQKGWHTPYRQSHNHDELLSNDENLPSLEDGLSH